LANPDERFLVSDVERMGVVLFQLPPNFRIDVPCLDSFLRETGSYSLRMAFEFRHASWFCDEVYDVLRNRGVALCVAESDELETPDIMTAPFACYRFRRSGYSALDIRDCRPFTPKANQHEPFDSEHTGFRPSYWPINGALLQPSNRVTDRQLQNFEHRLKI
jgi:uncharacterized protein YecE (DUF72 family)